jgi:plastocyanin
VKKWLIVLGVSLALFVAAIVPGRSNLNAAQPAEGEKKVQVTIDNFNYSPADLTIAPGTTVVWVNRDDVPHTVTSTEKKFSSRALDTDEQFTFTFNEKGTFDYYCSIHPKMTARVTVK